MKFGIANLEIIKNPHGIIPFQKLIKIWSDTLRVIYRKKYLNILKNLLRGTLLRTYS
jgi:hypothetical protein